MKRGGKVEKAMESAVEGAQTHQQTLWGGKGHHDTGMMIVLVFGGQCLALNLDVMQISFGGCCKKV